MKKFIVVFDLTYADGTKMTAGITVEAETAITAGLHAADILPDYLSDEFDGSSINKIEEIP